MDTTVAAVSLLYFIISLGPWNNRSAIEITFSSPRVWIPPSDRPSHGIFCLAGHSWVAPASSLICPSYSGLTRRIPAEGISEAFFKIFVNLEDISSVSQENTCWIKKKMWRVSRRQTPESYSCHLISLHPVWKIKIPLLQLCNMTHIWGSSFFYFYTFFSPTVVVSRLIIPPHCVPTWI